MSALELGDDKDGMVIAHPDKNENGRMSLVPVEFETAELVRGLVHSIDERARSKGLKLIVDIKSLWIVLVK